MNENESIEFKENYNVAIQNNSKGDMDIIIKYIEKNGSITRINAQALINKEKTTTSTILNKNIK